MIGAVKRYENGFITNPIVIGPNETIDNVLKIKDKMNFCGFPVTETGMLEVN